MEKVKAAGVKVNTVADKKPFQDAMKPVHDKFRRQSRPGRPEEHDAQGKLMASRRRPVPAPEGQAHRRFVDREDSSNA